MKKTIFIFIVFIFLSGLLSSQTVNDYQSVASGNWNALGTWNIWNGAAWVAPAATPTAANAQTITIVAGHTVTQNIGANALSIDQVVVNGTLQTQTTAANGSFTIANGAGVDLTINGTFIDNLTTGVITWTGNWQFGVNGTLIKTGAASSNNWQSNYSGGISTVPSTANWIIRKTGTSNPALSTTTPGTGSVYPNLTIENNTATAWATPVGSSFTGNVAFPTVKGNLDIGGTGTNTVDFLNSNTNASPLLVNGNVTIRTGCNYRNYGTGIEIQGNLSAVGTGSITYDAADGRKIVLSGANVQNISGTGTLNVYDFTLNKSGGSVNLNKAMTVDNLMTFTGGIIYTTLANLLTINTSGSVTGANNSSFVSGPIRYVGLAAFTFPVGKNTDYQALSYSASSGGSFWTETFDNGCAANCSANGVNTGNGAWTIDNSNNPALDNCFEPPQSSVWYVSCAENGNASGACGSGCAANATLHIGSATLGDLGASFDAGGYCDILGGGWGGGTNTNTMVYSPAISTVGQTNITLSFKYLHYGNAGSDYGWVDYSINNGASWLTLVNPMPQVVCCGGPCNNTNQGQWATYSTLLPVAAENIAGFRLRFGWINNDDGAGNDPSFAINDITLGQPTPVCDFTCEYFYADPQTTFNNNLAPTLGYISACEYWILTRNAGTENKTLTLTWDANSCPPVPTLSDTRVAHFDNTIWQDEGNGGNTGTVSAGTVTSAAPVTYFSPFTIGFIPLTVLPVELLDFSGIKNKTVVDLKWSTSSETNCSYYEIERSADGVSFESIGKINGTGTSQLQNNYFFTDYRPLPGVSYYRLKQFDYNGKYKHSKTISVYFSLEGSLSIINQSIVNESLSFSVFCTAKEPLLVEIFDVTGNKIFSTGSEINGQIVDFSIPINKFAGGIYLLRVSDGKQWQVQKLVF